jgi:hypothetical protein
MQRRQARRVQAIRVRELAKLSALGDEGKIAVQRGAVLLGATMLHVSFAVFMLTGVSTAFMRHLWSGRWDGETRERRARCQQTHECPQEDFAQSVSPNHKTMIPRPSPVSTST